MLTSGKELNLLPHHLEHLRASGLDDESVTQAGLYSETSYTRLASMLNGRYSSKNGPAIVFPYVDDRGDVVLNRVRPDNPPTRQGKPGPKYLSPVGSTSRLYVPASAWRLIDDTGKRLFITEGEKKALALTQGGFPAVGIAGVDCFHKAKSARLLPDMERFKWKGREVYIVFDSDIDENPAVEVAERKLAAALRAQGAVVRSVRLPATPAGGKQGADDFLVAAGAVELHKLVNAAEEVPEPEPGAEREHAKNIEPADEAKRFLRRFHYDGFRGLAYWNSVFYRWRRGRYEELSTVDLKAALTEHLSRCFFGVGVRHVGDVMLHIQSQALVPATVDAPAWLERNEWKPRDLVCGRNVILHLPSMATKPATPRLFTLSAVPFDIDATDNARPEKWLQFLSGLWPDDSESIEALQRWFGYCLTPDTSQQKLLMVVGPMRSGKGTIAKVLSLLVGKQNTAGPSLASMGRQFGLSQLLNATLAIVSDARLSGRNDTSEVVEAILNITGEDPVGIDRKHMPVLTTTLKTRLMILSNELPRMNDSSGALVGRMIVLRMRQSFYGREDPNLFNELTRELPGILHWAIEGWRKLHEAGRLLQPSSGAELVDEMNDLASPIGAFVRQFCIVDQSADVSREEMFKAYQAWCDQEGRKYINDAAGFGRDLRSAVTDLGTCQKRYGTKRVRHYTGVMLNDKGAELVAGTSAAGF